MGGKTIMSYEALKFELEVLRSNKYNYIRIIKDKDKHIRNLQTRLKRANQEIRYLKQPKMYQISIFDSTK